MMNTCMELSLIECLNEPSVEDVGESSARKQQAEVRVEAAHILASLAQGAYLTLTCDCCS
jgi:hypothetical protein